MKRRQLYDGVDVDDDEYDDERMTTNQIIWKMINVRSLGRSTICMYVCCGRHTFTRSLSLLIE